MNEFDFYTREQLSDRLWVVTESYGVNSTFRIFVLTGDNHTVVIDSGLGAQSGLRRYIETYIARPDLPASVLLTHTHPDHVGGAPLFDHVYCNPQEFPYLAWNRCHHRRFGDLEWFCGRDRWKEDPDFEVLDFCYLHFVRELLQEEDCIHVYDGDILSFGDIQLEAIYCPSHSFGSTCYYDRASHTCFVGDAIQHWNGYVGRQRGPEALMWVDRLIAKLPEDVIILNAHDAGVYGMDFLKDNRQCLMELNEGIGLEYDGPVGYTNHFHFTRKSSGPREMKDHYVNDVRLTYNALDL